MTDREPTNWETVCLLAVVVAALLYFMGCHSPPRDRPHELKTCWRLYGPDSAPISLVERTDRPILRCLVEQYDWRIEDAEKAVLLQSSDYREAKR